MSCIYNVHVHTFIVEDLITLRVSVVVEVAKKFLRNERFSTYIVGITYIKTAISAC
jgi:hypothetical protein